MNKGRRKELSKAHDLLDQVKEILSAVKDEEEEALGNMPESLQGSEKGEKMDSTVNDLDDLVSTLDEAQNTITEIIER
jgi:hypothetical protein